MELKDEGIEFVRLVGTERRTGSTLAEVSKHWQGGNERFLFVSPHDDDAVLGCGLMMQLAQREKVPVYIAVVTDGSQGYCTEEEKNTIAETRRRETFECYESLGIPRQNIIWMAFPDCRLGSLRGRRKSTPQDLVEMRGFAGLQNSFTFYLRKIRPTQCFLPTSNDLHPDHRIVYEEFLISLFHAAGDIWPELGDPLAGVPHVNTYAVYCDFWGPPTLRMRTPMSYLEKKLEAIGRFKSQKQIAALVANVRDAGAEEYIRSIEFTLYHPARYRILFDEARGLDRMH